MTEEKIREILPHLCYTKEEVDLLIQAAVDEARAIDEAYDYKQSGGGGRP